MINMADERIHTIPLRKAYRGVRQRRAKKAISVIREYLQRHMKVDDVNIGQTINKSIWAQGIQKPPRRIRIHTTVENGIAYAELIGTEIKLPSAAQVKEKEKKKQDKKEKIKEERKERKKQTIQDEIKEEHGKKTEIVEEKLPKEIPAEQASREQAQEKT